MSAPDLGPLRDPLCNLPAYCRQAVEAERQRTYAAGVAAETGRQSDVIRHLNARCDHLGMALRDAKAAGVAAAEALTAALDGSYRLPPPDTHTYDENEKRDVWSYSPALVLQIVQMEREAMVPGAERSS